jgi:ABC-type dipeptide/oligopeptide/nickel transport system ATPase subunit
MSRIKDLQIYNFKFFNEVEPIKLNGKHLLLYGENGSGKSSIYWALYTLFEAALKKDKGDIEKYFKHHTEHKQSLINIHTKPVVEVGDTIYNSFIKVITDEDQTTEFEISLNKTDIKNNLLAKEINQASDFISYKVLYKFQDFWNGSNMDLANIFIGYILPYLNFPKKELIKNGASVKFSNASEMYDEILKGPGTVLNAKGKQIQAYKNSPENKKFNLFVEHFNKNIKEIIDFININAPKILKKLGYNIVFELRFAKLTTEKGYTNFKSNKFKIEFVITEYLGKTITITRPQSFLNEAKITAIALAIRLAVLRKRINKEAGDILKFIVFDDVMISLDMNNRDMFIDFLLDPENAFTEDYQLLFLTHDRSLFFYLKDKIRNSGLKDDWIYKEMYVDTLSDIEIPAIYDYPNKSEKANYFIHKHDYPAAGIYLRRLCEELLDNIYGDQKKYTIGLNREGIYESKNQSLNDKIINLEKFCSEENLDFTDYKDLRTYKSVILNSLAHNDISSPLYKSELIKVYKVLEELKQIKREVTLIKQKKSLKIILTKNDGKPYEIGIKINDKLMMLEKVGSFRRISNSKIIYYQF